MSGSNPFYDPPSGQPANPNAQNILTGEQQYLDRQPAPQTPTQTIGGFQQVQAQGIANKNAMMAQQAQLAWGQAIQNNTDPTTGQVDYGAAIAHAAMDPRATYGMPDFVTSAIANGKVTADTVKTTLGNQLDRLQAINQGFASLTSNPNPTQDDVRNEIGTLVANNVIPKNEALSEIAQLPPDGPGLAAYIKQRSQMSQAAQTTLEQNLGTVSQVNLGGVVSPLPSGQLGGGGTGPQGPGVATTPTAQDMNALVTVQMPDGTSKLVPRAQAAAMVNGAGGQTNPGVDVTPTAQLSDQDKQVLGPYQTDLNNRAGQASVVLQNLAQMAQAEQAFKSGGGTKFYQGLAQKAQALGMPDSIVQGLGSGDLAALQEFEKLQVVNSMQQLRAAAGAAPLSTAEFDTFRNTIMNPDSDPRALTAIIKYQQELAQQPLIEQQLLRKYVGQGGSPSNFPNVWNKFLEKSGRVNLTDMPDLGQGNSSDPASQPLPANITP